MNETTPNPGSRAAQGQGCTCPRAPNLFGLGRLTPTSGRALNIMHSLLLSNHAGERRWFTYDENCTLHGAGDWLE